METFTKSCVYFLSTQRFCLDFISLVKYKLFHKFTFVIIAGLFSVASGFHLVIDSISMPVGCVAFHSIPLSCSVSMLSASENLLVSQSRKNPVTIWGVMPRAPRENDGIHSAKQNHIRAQIMPYRCDEHIERYL